MAKKIKASDDGKRIKFTDWKNTKWVLNNLDDEQIAKIDAAEFDTGRYLDWLSYLVDNGMEIKLGYDDWSKCYQATITGAWENFLNTGYAVSARSDEGFEDALKILWGKFEFIAQGDLAACYEKKPKRSKRG